MKFVKFKPFRKISQYYKFKFRFTTEIRHHFNNIFKRTSTIFNNN